MQIVRSGGEYLANRQRELKARRLWVVALSTLVAAGLGVAWHPIGSAVALLAGVGFVRPIQRQLRRIRRGQDGETVVTEFLHRLSDEYFLVNDVVLPGQRGNVDHVVIGPCGVVVIETKRYAGVIACRGNAWSVNGRPIRNLTRQVNAGAVAIRQFLGSTYPALRPTALASVDGIVVFTDPLCRIEVDRPRTTVVRLSELLGVILEKGQRQRLSPADAATLARALQREVTAGPDVTSIPAQRRPG